MKSGVTVKLYQEMPFDFGEIRRYAGIKETKHSELLKECTEEIKGRLSYRVCFVRLPISELSRFCIDSKDLSDNLKGCCEGIVFAATIGLEADRLITRYSRISPSKALIFQAIGAERIESLCDEFNNEIKSLAEAQGLFARPRFSPGYGDFSVIAQKKIFEMLDCPRKIGLTLNDSLIMSPSKSVTAIIGLSEFFKKCRTGCAECTSKECEFRR